MPRALDVLTTSRSRLPTASPFDRSKILKRLVKEFQRGGQPVIPVDTKKKELIGDFKNAGKQWRPKQTPDLVRVHDFIIPEKGKAIPYGVYDLTRNNGWVSVGIDHDTASFAARTILRWWRKMGQPAYPRGRRLLVTADAGGSNGPRIRLWKWEVQQLADRIGMAVTVCHFPPGTSKWNKIEHRLFGYISTNWRGQPPRTRRTWQGLVPKRPRSPRRADVVDQAGAAPLPRGLELHHPPETQRKTVNRSVIV